MNHLKDQIAIVTGAAGGFGEGIARLFVAEGARVLIADLDEGKARKLADELGPSARAVACDGRTLPARPCARAASVDRPEPARP